MKKSELHDAIAPRLLAGLEGAEAQEGQRLLDALLDDWLREAGTGDEAPAVLGILQDDLQAAQEGRSAGERLALLRGQVVERRLRRLGGRSFDLGMRILKGEVDDRAARTEGEALMDDIASLAPQLRALDDSDDKRRLQRDLQEASMEALYAIERQGMSMRLNNAAHDLSDEPGPPSVH